MYSKEMYEGVTDDSPLYALDCEMVTYSVDFHSLLRSVLFLIRNLPPFVESTF